MPNFVRQKRCVMCQSEMCVSLEIGIRQFPRNSILSDNPMTKSYYLVLIGHNNVNSV